uniref:Uncharacterized protein n=1 Tax=Oryza glumipatula TaxID=40148 RepID=A0A0E0AG82_9ORYZ
MGSQIHPNPSHPASASASSFVSPPPLAPIPILRGEVAPGVLLLPPHRRSPVSIPPYPHLISYSALSLKKSFGTSTRHPYKIMPYLSFSFFKPMAHMSSSTRSKKSEQLILPLPPFTFFSRRGAEQILRCLASSPTACPISGRWNLRLASFSNPPPPVQSPTAAPAGGSPSLESELLEGAPVGIPSCLVTVLRVALHWWLL